MSKLQDILTKAVRVWLPHAVILENHRPEWLHGMEIDIFLPDQRVAIEVQGRQHRLFCPTMQGTLLEHQAQRQRDTSKRRIITKRGFTLLAVKEGCPNLFCGLQAKLSKRLGTRLQSPKWLKQEWREHKKTLSSNHQHKNVAFKVRRGGKLVPVNRASSDFASSHSSAINITMKTITTNDSFPDRTAGLVQPHAPSPICLASGYAISGPPVPKRAPDTHECPSGECSRENTA